MLAWRRETKAGLVGAVLLFSLQISNVQARASTVDNYLASPSPRPVSARLVGLHHVSQPQRYAYANGKRLDSQSYGPRFYGISCVPYARQVSGIEVVGDAWTWWTKAAGAYARGSQPEPGSVLAFRANGRMHLGHVAVVRRIVNAREVIVDHANWSNGGGHGDVSRNVAVVDVSEANNWSAVRVQLANGRNFGSVYPTYGFIYNRPDTGAVTARVDPPAPLPDINPVPSDLRPVAERPWRTIEELAEAPDTGPRRINLQISQPAVYP